MDTENKTGAEEKEKPGFKRTFLNSSVFRIDNLVTQGKLSAEDFPLKAYKLEASYHDMHADATVVVAESWFLSDRANTELVMQRYDRGLGALGEMINCVTLAAGFFRNAAERREQSQKLVFIANVKGINLLPPPDNETFTKRSSAVVNDVTTYVAGIEKPSIIAVSAGVYSGDGGRCWDTDFTKPGRSNAKCMVLNTGHHYAFKDGQSMIVFDMSK